MFKNANFKLIRLIAGYLLILLLLLGNGWFLYFNFEKMSGQQNSVVHTYEVIGAVDETISGIKDAETGTRGYILSGDEGYLSPFYTGSALARTSASRAVVLTQDNPVQNRSAIELKNLLDRRLVIFEKMISARRKYSATDKEVLSFLSEGKILMDGLRVHVAMMKAVEGDLLTKRTMEAENARQFFLFALFGSTAVALLVLSGAYVQFRRTDIKIEEELRKNIQIAKIKQNVAEVATLTTGEQGLENLGSDILSFLLRRLDILAGKLYILERGQLLTIASVGVTEDKKTASSVIDKNFLFEALKKDGVWEVRDVPPQFWKIQSGMGEALPNRIIFLPIKFQNKPFALFELGAFQELSPEQIEMLEKIMEILAINLNSAQTREHLQQLLEETQTQSEELQSQQEELRTSNEELEQQARALESQQDAMQIKNKELEGIRREMEFKAKELSLASQYKSEFLAKMSHELRTPLNGLLILSSLLFENKENNLTDQQKQFAKSIYNAGNDLLALINDILDLSKIEARKLRLMPENLALQDTLSQMKLVFDPQAAAKNITLDVETDDELKGKNIFTDRQRLEQILRNFLSNAIKFTDKGSIHIAAKVIPGNKNHLDICVRDSGIGIAQDKQALVFEAFEQADGSVSRRFGGTGLGLTISRELATLLGGEILLVSAEGRGSTFTLRIPFMMPEQSQTQKYISTPEIAISPAPAQAVKTLAVSAAAQTMNLEAQTRVSGLTSDRRVLLIVEDDDKFRTSVVEVAKAYGYQTIEAEDGELAVSILQKITPDAILLDIKLPGISGMGILEMIKQMPHLRHVPVHMISAMDYQLNALRMGALGYLTKPVTMEKIKSALDRIEHILTEKVRRVLLIEDDERQSEAVSNLISGNDVQVVSATNGKDAIEILVKGEIDCIILDLSLPDLSGFDLLEKLNSLHISLPPIVIYTGKDLSHAEEEKLRKYSQSIIIKGARSPERLLDEVNLFLHRVESLLPDDKQEMLSTLRSQDNSFEGKTVLLVDDDLRNLFALTSALEGRGLVVRTAKNGFEAIEALEIHADIQVVLMDIMMPKMDGYEAMRRIRKHEDKRLNKMPIIALTAKAMKEDHEKCIAAGASDYLPKPVNLENLFTAMKVWLSPRGIFA